MSDNSALLPKRRRLSVLSSSEDQTSNACNFVTTFCWQIINFKKQWSNARSKNKSYLASNPFSLITRSRIRFVLVFKSSEATWTDNWYGILLKDLGGNETVEIEYKTWFENDQGHKCDINEFASHTFVSRNSGLGWNGLLENDAALLNKIYEKHETLHFCCQIIDLNPVVEIDREFLQNQWNLLGHEKHDAIVKIGEVEFKVMKSFFMAQFNVFTHMFSSNHFKEGQTSIVDIKDVSIETIKALVKWLYTGQLENTGFIEDMFEVADKYDIKVLKKLCIRRLLDSMDKKNAFSRLIIASMHSEDHLKDAALAKITQMSAVETRKMLTDPAWLEFTRKNVSISDEVSKLVNGKMSE